MTNDLTKRMEARRLAAEYGRTLKGRSEKVAAIAIARGRNLAAEERG